MGSSLAAHNHAVHFYGSETVLFQTVAAFVAEGLKKAEPALVIATPAHRTAILQHLRRNLIDCDRSVRHGDLLLLDAQATLDLFMVNGEPNPAMFFRNIGRLIEQTLNGRKTVVRAYGEMVDVLWRAGQPNEAIQLEVLWNRLAEKYRFSLLCGYSLGNFSHHPDGIALVRAHHSHIVSNSSSVRRFPARAERTA